MTQDNGAPPQPSVIRVYIAVGILAVCLVVLVFVGTGVVRSAINLVQKDPLWLWGVRSIAGAGIVAAVIWLSRLYGKTLWMWLELLIVPLALVGIGLLFAAQQDERQREFEEQRARVEQEIEEQRAQAAALQSYLDQMGLLILEHDLAISGSDSEVSTVAQARTLTVLEALDADQKSTVLQFLGRLGLLHTPAVVNLRGADLSGVDASENTVSLIHVDLTGANLQGADLRNQNLVETNLSYANLSDAQLNGTFMGEPPFSLPGPSLAHADLSGADLRDVFGLQFADLHGADLSGAALEGLQTWDGAPFDGEALEAKVLCKDREGKEIGSLKGATMPNGQKYEEWLKDQEDRGEGRVRSCDQASPDPPIGQ